MKKLYSYSKRAAALPLFVQASLEDYVVCVGRKETITFGLDCYEYYNNQSLLIWLYLSVSLGCSPVKKMYVSIDIVIYYKTNCHNRTTESRPFLIGFSNDNIISCYTPPDTWFYPIVCGQYS